MQRRKEKLRPYDKGLMRKCREISRQINLLRNALEVLKMQQRIKVNGPSDAKSLRHEYLRILLIPVSGTEAFKSGNTEIIGNAQNVTMPCTLLWRPTQLLPE